jgi:formylglycine-generating enzyme required for sulfatase activity
MTSGIFFLAFQQTQRCGCAVTPDSSSYRLKCLQNIVSLPEFDISIYPVTNGQFMKYILSENASLPRYWRNSSGTIEQRIFQNWVVVNPQEVLRHVTWYEAVAYCEWSKQRLPSEQEWEAAHAHLQGIGQVIFICILLLHFSSAESF